MRLLNLFLVLSILSMPVLASESKGVSSLEDESSKSLFTEISGKSVLVSRTLSKIHFENFNLDYITLEPMSYLQNSKNNYVSEYQLQTVIDSKYSGSDQHADYSSFHNISPAILSYYLAHDIQSNEHLSFYNREMKEHGLGIHDDFENHHICTPVPEPESYVMVILGLLMIVMLKRKKT